MKRDSGHRSSRTLRISSIVWGLLAMALLPMLTGCEEEDIRAYEAPKSEPYAEPEIFTRLSTPQHAPAAIGWEVPEGWVESANASNILFAVFEAGHEAGDARITVTKLSTDGGGVLANINRWRGQVGLEPVPSIEKQPMTLVQAGGDPAGLIDLASPEGVDAGLERMLVVMLPRQQEHVTWYFKMTGPKAALDVHKASFISFVESVNFGQHGAEDPEGETVSDTGDEAGGSTGGDVGE